MNSAEPKILYIVLVTAFLTGCSFFMDMSETGPGTDTSSYLYPFLSSCYDGNLRINAEELSEDYILCVNGDALGTVKAGSDLLIKIKMESDGLKNLWLLPAFSVDSEDDIYVENADYSWITKLYSSGVIREWVPGSSTAEDSGEIIFYPPESGSKDWDYAVGYLNGDETFAPVAILSPYDKYRGVSTEVDFGRINILWKYYSNGSVAGTTVLTAEKSEEFIFTIDEAGKSHEIPAVGDPNVKSISLTFNNLEEYIVRIYLNGEPIEQQMDEVKIGYSDIEAGASRTYRLSVNTQNILTVRDDYAEVSDLIFYADDNESIIMEFSEASGIVISARDIMYLYDDIMEETVFQYDFDGNFTPDYGYFTEYYYNMDFTYDRFSYTDSALWFLWEYASFEIYDSLGVMDSPEFLYVFWIKPYEGETDYLVFECCDAYSDAVISVRYDSYSGLDLQLYADSISPELTRTAGGNTELSDGLWHMVSLVKSESSVQLYLDGELAEEDESYASYFYSADTCIFGGTGYYDSSYFKGAIDDFSYFDSALCEGEVETLFEARL